MEKSLVEQKDSFIIDKESLKQQLDVIDQQVIKDVTNGFYESRLKIEMGMWEKGKTVGDYRGVKSPIPSWRQLEKETERNHESLKKWNDLYEKYPEEEKYLEIAKQKAEAWTLKALTKMEALRQAEEEKTEAVLPPGEFRVIVIDPPWPYGTEYDLKSRRVGAPYPEMSIEEIAKIKIPAADDCVLWLWTTHKFLPKSFELLEEWGFEYKITLSWDKQKMGMGVWLRCQCEFCLLAIKGKPIWKLTNERDFISEARREHSRKPEGFYEMVEKLCNIDKNKEEALDYFARQKRQGWRVYGNETNKFKN